LLHHAQHLQPVREQQVASFAHAWPVMRRGVIRLGDALFADGLIATPDDVFFLTRNELAEALAGRELPVAVATARRAARDAARRLTPPQTVGRMPLMTRTTFALVARAFGAQEVDGALVAGVPASPGIATGPVRVLREAADYETLQPGDVIVAPVTTPALTPLFSRAAALVTDVGSGLAHASIMAREFGVPAVVGCGDATARLTDGLVVTVDGATGAVTAATPVARP
jgi:pyruvate,water dikinase